MKTPILAIALAAGLTATLAGCTSAATPDSSKAPSSTKSASPSASYTPKAGDTYKDRPDVAPESEIYHPSEQKTASCKNGKATISDNSSEVTLKGECAKVTVTAGNTIVHLGDVQTLTITGNINRVEAKKVGKVVVEKAAKGNDVLYTGDKPSISDKGDSTRFAAVK